MNKDQLRAEFEKVEPLYRQIASNTKGALVQFLEDREIAFHDVEYRVKTFDSFYNKIDRKGYKNPFYDMTDICGIRIINYYPSDLEVIKSIINEEFDVVESSNKEEEMEDDRFGYRSFHFVVKINSNWLSAPNYRGLGGLTFEIQARTILMHSWATISHKLSYKHERDIPKKFKRELFRLSALIELADEQFEKLRLEKKAYSESFIESDPQGVDKFVPRDKINTDSLQALLDYYFSDRERSEDISTLVREISDLGLDLAEFKEKVESVIEYLDEIERDESAANGSEIRWAQVGAARTVLDLASDEYFMRHESGHIPEGLLEVIRSWRGKIFENS